MTNVLCVTNKSAVQGDFLEHIELLLQGSLYGLILREKELDVSAYRSLAISVHKSCEIYKTPLFLNANFADFMSATLPLARELGCGVHSSFENYVHAVQTVKENLPQKYAFVGEDFSSCIPLGISIHSILEAEFIKNNFSILPVQYVLVGHIFSTECKKGLEARGLEFLSSIVQIFAKEGVDFASSYKNSIDFANLAIKKNAYIIKSVNDMQELKTHIPIFAIGGMTPERVPLVLEIGTKGVAVMSSLMQAKDPLALLKAFHN